ncbi:MAG: hypothetical protein AAB736_02770 [Patescibacteria group bacterium]
MDKKSKILITTMFIFIALSVVATFYRTIVTKNYPIINIQTNK